MTSAIPMIGAVWLRAIQRPASYGHEQTVSTRKEYSPKFIVKNNVNLNLNDKAQKFPVHKDTLRF